MQTLDVPPARLATARVDAHTKVLNERERREHAQLVRRIGVHVGVFIASFVFTAGASTIGVLLWVRPDSLGALVGLGVFSSLLFVVCFSLLRLVILHGLMNEYEEGEDLGTGHHVGKSIVYALLALVVAMLLTGLLIQTATASGRISGDTRELSTSTK